MSWEIKSIELGEHKVKLVFEDRDIYGYLKERQQKTFRRRQFEAALRNAKVVVPWDEVSS